MKKLFTICVLITMGSFVTARAQVLATFENTATDQLEKGDKWYDPSRFVLEPSIGDNSAKGGSNTSDKCFVAVNVPDADWWGNFGELKLKTPITITEQNRYLKFLAYRSIQPKDFRVAINGDHEEASMVYQGSLSADATWQGMVVDLGAKFMGQELKSIVFVYSCNWSDPRNGWGAATYMFDNFELSDKPLPPGVTEVTDLSDFYINFEDQSKIDKYVSKFDVINAANSYEITNNTASSDVNPTQKMVTFNKSSDASWWQGFRTVFKNALKISDDYRYLHVMLWAPESVLAGRESADVQLCAKDFSGKENTYTDKIWDDQVNGWIDFVMNVTDIQYMTELTVRFDIQKDGDNYINSPANTFYIDELTLNNNPEPRRDVLSRISPTVDDLSNVKVSGGKNIVRLVSDKMANVTIYNVFGNSVKNVVVSGVVSIPLAKGIYLVKINSSGKQKIVKVLVK